MVRLDPQYRLVFGARRRADCTPDVARMEARGRAALPGRRRRTFRRFLADNRVKLERFRPVLERPFLGWRDLLSLGPAEDAAAAAAVAVARRRAGPLLPRPARPAGVHVPVEVPGHVAVQLPEPVLDPVVPRIRVRRLPPGRRLRRGQPRRWPASADDLGVEISPGRGRRGDAVRGPAGRRRADRPRATYRADAAGDQRRLRPRHDAARARPPAPPLDRRARSPGSGSPARRS